MVRSKSNSGELRLDDATSAVANVRALPERHEPDGGEDGGVHSLEKTDADENWSDWEAEEDVYSNDQEEKEENFESLPVSVVSSISEKKLQRSTNIPTKVIKKPLIESDLAALEIQVKSREDEIDYFADMTPTITSTPAVFAPVPMDLPTASTSTKPNGLDFNVQSQEEKDEDDGWNWDD